MKCFHGPPGGGGGRGSALSCSMPLTWIERERGQGCQAGLFEAEAKHDKFGLFLNGWPRNFGEFIK